MMLIWSFDQLYLCNIILTLYVFGKVQIKWHATESILNNLLIERCFKRFWSWHFNHKFIHNNESQYWQRLRQTDKTLKRSHLCDCCFAIDHVTRMSPSNLHFDFWPLVYKADALQTDFPTTETFLSFKFVVSSIQ